MKKKRLRGRVRKKYREYKYMRNFFLVLAAFLIVLTLFFILFLLIFPPEPLSGKSTQGTIGLTILGRCSQALSSGWNLFSMCSNATNKSIDSILSGIDYRYIMKWNTTTMSYDIYSPRASEKPFADLKLTDSYFVLLYDGETFSIPGDNNDNMDIGLVTGWDAPSYPYEFSTNVTNYLDSIAGNYRFVMKWNRAAQEFDIYSPRAETNPFTKIFIGEGQFINCYTSDILEYNRTKCLNG